MRVLVLRPQDDALETARLLQGRGHEAIVAPVSQIVGLKQIVTELWQPDRFAASIVTSANALRFLSRKVLGKIASLPCFVVGESTAAQAQQSGFEKIFVAEGDVKALIARVMSKVEPSDRVIYIAGNPRKPHMEEAFLQAGRALAVHETYLAEPVGQLPESGVAALKSGIDAILHFSRRSAETSLRLIQQSGLMAEAANARHLCLAPDVAGAFANTPEFRIEIAEMPTQSALLVLLETR